MADLTTIQQQLKAFVKMYKADKDLSDHRMQELSHRVEEFSLNRLSGHSNNKSNESHSNQHVDHSGICLLPCLLPRLQHIDLCLKSPQICLLPCLLVDFSSTSYIQETSWSQNPRFYTFSQWILIALWLFSFRKTCCRTNRSIHSAHSFGIGSQNDSMPLQH